MKVKLLEPHYFRGDLYYEAETIIGPGGKPLPEGFLATHKMEGLDDEGVKAVAKAVERWRKGDPINTLPMGGVAA